MPLAIAELLANPSESATRTGMMGQPHAGEATPMKLLLAAAAVPATAVPCPNRSCVSALLLKIFQPGLIFATRSGWVASTPVSQIAMTTSDLPVVVVQASPAWIAARCH